MTARASHTLPDADRLAFADLMPTAATAAIGGYAADALDGLREQTGDAQTHWRGLAEVLLTGRTLADMRVCGDLDSRQRLHAGGSALMAMRERYLAGDALAPMLVEVTAIDEALWVLRAQLETCTQGELDQAYRRAVGAMPVFGSQTW